MSRIVLPGRLNPGLGNYVAEQFNKEGVSIPILGCDVHLFETDEQKFQSNIDRFKEHIRYVRFFGASVVATKTGKALPDNSEEENWKRLSQALTELKAEAERWGIFIGIEPAEGHLIDTPEMMLKCIKENSSKNIGVVLDMCHLIHSLNIEKQDQIIRKSIQLLNNWIVSVHIKDFIFDSCGERKTVPQGKGLFNTKLFLQQIDKYKPMIHMIMEGINETEMAEAISCIKDLKHINEENDFNPFSLIRIALDHQSWHDQHSIL